MLKHLMDISAIFVETARDSTGRRIAAALLDVLQKALVDLEVCQSKIKSLEEEVEDLRARVDQKDLAPERLFDQVTLNELDALSEEGRKVAMIKILRQQTGLSLGEAKDYVEEWWLL